MVSPLSQGLLLIFREPRTRSISGPVDDLRELVGWHSDMTGDNIYRREIGDRDITGNWPLTGIYLFCPEVFRYC